MPRHGNFDSSGPEGRIRGNAHQVYEKYIGLARDAQSSGDRIAAETYFQHAEHYYRIVNARTDPKPIGDGQSDRRDGNGQSEAVDAADLGDSGEQPSPEALNGEQPAEAPQAQNRPAGQGRRRPRQAKAAAPRTDLQPEAKPEAQPEDQPSEGSEPAEA